MRLAHSLFLLLLLLFPIRGLQTLRADNFRFRVYLKDKGWRNETPKGFLSPAAVQRRERYGIPVDETDYPIAPSRLDELRNCGTNVVTVGKWFGTVVVECADSSVVSSIEMLPFVEEVRLVWKGDSLPEPRSRPVDTLLIRPATEPAAGSAYGFAEPQLAMLNGIALHEKGFRGKGMTIAVIDAGFRNVDRMEAFRRMDLAGSFNMVSPAESVFLDDDHGIKVLSCMAADLPGITVGAAPEASYWLIKSEDAYSEYPIEEDFWLAAAELADSAGVDVISSSLGYSFFDDEQLNYSAEMLNGRSTLISMAAEKAAEKGMLVFVSSGNEAGSDWGAISFPADAHNVITVGGITVSKKRSSFSAWGLTTDGRIKPDVVALGTNAAVINAAGDLSFSSGTSFATPIVAGLGACLWQALPHLTNTEIARLILQHSSQFSQPDSTTGYGLPDFGKALNHSLNEKRTK